MKRTVSILNEIMSITEYERDKEDTTGTLIYMYMVDALRALSSERINLKFNGELKPFLIKNPEDDSLTELIVPIGTY